MVASLRRVTLLTDYGERDGYPGAMKGAVLSECPDAHLTDLTHTIAPQDTLAGAVAVWTATLPFPPGTVHLVVIDPDVGTERAGLIVQWAQQTYVAPDSGVLHFVLRQPDAKTWHIDPKLRRAGAGTTFDGRDWFGPVAGKLAAGAHPEELGRPAEAEFSLSLPDPRFDTHRWVGHVLHVDRFGNIISDLPAPAAELQRHARVFVKEQPIGPIRNAFASVGAGSAVATIGALGTVEVGINCGDACRRFAVQRGDSFELLFAAPTEPPQMPW